LNRRRNTLNTSPSDKGASYADSGVSRDEGYRTVHMIRTLLAGHSRSAAANIGSFAAIHPIPGIDGLLLGAATDGVGTKIELAVRYGTLESVGQDCVAMCVNDLACHGITPLFFLDYLACDTLSADTASRIVAGVADAAAFCGARLIGGETAEMPGVYTPDSYDIAGFAVGTVSADRVIHPGLIRGKEVLLGIPSSGVHSNGFSLIRAVITDMEAPFHGRPLWQTLLEPTALYPPVINRLLNTLGTDGVHGIAHITGGGLYENVPRILPPGGSAVIRKGAIPPPPVFDLIGRAGVAEDEMYHTFNMGVGMVVAIEPSLADRALEVLRADFPGSQVIGEVLSAGAGEGDQSGQETPAPATLNLE
jgi:phosphoribosylformylglycinamidine cyclo-ligase